MEGSGRWWRRGGRRGGRRGRRMCEGKKGEGRRRGGRRNEKEKEDADIGMFRCDLDVCMFICKESLRVV
jgi:hypothetical protein